MAPIVSGSELLNYRCDDLVFHALVPKDVGVFAMQLFKVL